MDTIRVVDKAIAEHGMPQRLLSDNGVALNPSRRGLVGQLVDHVSRLGVEAITGKPYKPTTQGKNERFHQILFHYLDKQPLSSPWPVRKVTSGGTINVDKVFFKIAVDHRFTQVLDITDGDRITIPWTTPQGHLSVTEVLRHHIYGMNPDAFLIEHVFCNTRRVGSVGDTILMMRTRSRGGDQR